MSDFDPTIGAIYIERMAPSVVAGIQEARVAEPDSRPLPPELRLFLAQTPIRDHLHQVDWAASGLPSTVKNLPSGAHADRLICAAFDDAYKVISLCVKHAKRKTLPMGSTLSEVLKNSKRSLLTIAMLAERDKNQILMRMSASPEILDLYEPLPLPPADEAVHLTRDFYDQHRFDWHPAITDFIQKQKTPNGGCPASRHHVTTPNGHQQTLIHYFWEGLIDTAFKS